MAYVKVLTVKERSHLHNLLDYIQNQNKTQNRKLITCHECQLETAYVDFTTLLTEHSQGRLLAHQLVQSFAPGEATPEQAHRIGVMLAEQMLPGYQYTVSTHVDKGHIHNHVVFAAVSYLTGERYHGNKTSLRLMQQASDTLCRQYGLSVIEQKSGYKGIDRDTYELARKGRSWKVRLVNDLDSLLHADAPPRSPDEFAAALRDRGYFVKADPRHIVVTKIGESKGIRLDTLARQFGVEYTRENIERRLRGEPVSREPPHAPETPADELAGEWQRAQRAVLHKQPAVQADEFFTTAAPEPPIKPAAMTAEVRNVLKMQKSLRGSRTVSGSIWRAVMLGILLLNKRTRMDYRQYRAWLRVRSMDTGVRVVETPRVPRQLRRFGNVTAARLASVYGETVSLRVSPEQAAAFAGMGIFYAGIIQDNGDIRVTFKACSTPAVAKALRLPEHTIKSREELADERGRRSVLQARMQAIPGSQRLAWHCTTADLRALDAARLPYDYTRIRDGYRVGVLDADLVAVCDTLGWNITEIRAAVSAYSSRQAYRQLKTQACEQGVKPVYRVMTTELLEAFRAAGVLCVAYDAKDGRKNVAMLPEALAVYEQLQLAAETPEQRNLRVYREIKAHTADAGVKPVYRVMPMELLGQLRDAGIRYAWFPKGGQANVAMTQEEWQRLRRMRLDIQDQGTKHSHKK